MNARDWLRFLRAPNAVTAAVDVLAGGLACGSSWSLDLAAAAAGSACLYMGGIALNDAMDAERDATEHPERAIPSGKLSHEAALRAAILLLGIGVLPLALASERIPAVLVMLTGIIIYDILPDRFPWLQACALGTVRGCNLLSGALLLNVPLDPRMAAACAGYGMLILILTRASQCEGTGKSVRLHGKFLFWAFLVPYAVWLNPATDIDQLPEFGVTLALAAFPLYTAWRLDSTPAELVRTTLRLIIPWMVLLVWCSGHGLDAIVVAMFAGLQLALARVTQFKTS